MGYRLTKIYTRTGDKGDTSLAPNHRIPKNNPRIEALGTLDELNSAIGLTLSFGIHSADIKTALIQIQQNVFNVSSELCPPHHPVITSHNILELEDLIDTWNATLPPLKEFILPGGNPPSASCHLARTICRRAERCLVTLHQLEPVNLDILRYLNRLSDVLFVAARMLAKETQSDETLWEHTRRKS